jgi:hypothetical protein
MTTFRVLRSKPKNMEEKPWGRKVGATACIYNPGLTKVGTERKII